jgi:acyl-CoA dehydrogenase
MNCAIHPQTGLDLSSRARRVAAVARQHANSVDAENRFPHEAMAAVKAERLLGVIIPVELGGEGCSLSNVAEVCAILGQACSSSAMIFAMHMIKLSSCVQHGQGHEWHRQLMRSIAGEQLLIASSTTESGSGDLRTSQCAVVREGEVFNLEKDATCISYGEFCDLILVTARAHSDAPPSDQVMVALKKGQYTLDRTSGWDTLGMRGTRSEGYLLKASAPVEQIFPLPFAEIAAQSMLAHCHLLWASLWYGVASEAFARAQQFVKAAARKAPNAHLTSALRLAELSVLLQQMRAIIVDGIARHEAASRTEEGLSAISYLVAMNNVKVSAAQHLVQALDHALLICGLAGYSNGSPFSIARLLRDGHSARVMVSNDRILSNTSSLLLIAKLDSTLLG